MHHIYLHSLLFTLGISDLFLLAIFSAPAVVVFHGDLPYTSKEIARRIDMIVESNAIGYGGSGTVYRLVMDDGSVFTVKKIEKHHIIVQIKLLKGNWRSWVLSNTEIWLIYEITAMHRPHNCLSTII